MVAVHALSANFNHFFGRLNPSPTVVALAASEQASITALIENPYGPAASLSPRCFLQGSYRQHTAIHTINDVDVVVLCQRWQPGSADWLGRDAIFDIIAAPLLADGRYRHKVRYSRTSMCIKVDLALKVELLPVVYRAGNYHTDREPFRLFRPERGRWEDGYARQHQGFLTWKNTMMAYRNFIPAIKVFKHLRSQANLRAVSFHIECLLYALTDGLYRGGAADFLLALLEHLASRPAAVWYHDSGILTPCRERALFSDTEWTWDDWQWFHRYVELWARGARLASASADRDFAIDMWQSLLGADFFPRTVAP